MSDYLFGLLSIPAGLLAVALCIAILRGIYLLFGSVLRVGVIRFGSRLHQPVISLLQRDPDDLRTITFSRGRFAVILLADTREKEGGQDD